MNMPTPDQTARLLRALDDAMESEAKKPGGHIKQNIQVDSVIEMVEKYPQLVSYAAETIIAMDGARHVRANYNTDFLKMMVAVQAFATLAKEILELDDERP